MNGTFRMKMEPGRFAASECRLEVCSTLEAHDTRNEPLSMMGGKCSLEGEPSPVPVPIENMIN